MEILPPTNPRICENDTHCQFRINPREILRDAGDAVKNDFLVPPYTLCLHKHHNHDEPVAKRRRYVENAEMVHEVCSNFYDSASRIDFTNLVVAGVSREGVQNPEAAIANPNGDGIFSLQTTGTTSLTVDPVEFVGSAYGDLLYWEEKEIGRKIEGQPDDYRPINIKVYKSNNGTTVTDHILDDTPFHYASKDHKRIPVDPSNPTHLHDLLEYNTLSSIMQVKPEVDDYYVDQNIRAALTDHYMQTFHMLTAPPQYAKIGWRKFYIDNVNSPGFIGIPYDAVVAWVAATIKSPDGAQATVKADSLILSMCDGYILPAADADQRRVNFCIYMSNIFRVNGVAYSNYMNSTVYAKYKEIYTTTSANFYKAWTDPEIRSEKWKTRLDSEPIAQYMEGHGIRGSLLGDAIESIHKVNSNMSAPPYFKEQFDRLIPLYKTFDLFGKKLNAEPAFNQGFGHLVRLLTTFDTPYALHTHTIQPIRIISAIDRDYQNYVIINYKPTTQKAKGPLLKAKIQSGKFNMLKDDEADKILTVHRHRFFARIVVPPTAEDDGQAHVELMIHNANL